MYCGPPPWPFCCPGAPWCYPGCWFGPLFYAGSYWLYCFCIISAPLGPPSFLASSSLLFWSLTIKLLDSGCWGYSPWYLWSAVCPSLRALKAALPCGFYCICVLLLSEAPVLLIEWLIILFPPEYRLWMLVMFAVWLLSGSLLIYFVLVSSAASGVSTFSLVAAWARWLGFGWNI